jgi:hypothetical protein
VGSKRRTEFLPATLALGALIFWELAVERRRDALRSASFLTTFEAEGTVV